MSLLNLYVVIALIVMLLLMGLILVLEKRFKTRFVFVVILALLLGACYGICIQFIFKKHNTDAKKSLQKWLNVPAQMFVRSLQFLVVPLVSVSIVKAISQFTDSFRGTCKALKIISILLLTTFISSIIAIITVKSFHLDISDLVPFKNETRNASDIPQTLINIVPSNLVDALSSNLILPIIFISLLVGSTNLILREERPLMHQNFQIALETAYVFIMKIVVIVIKFTPYGILPNIAVTFIDGSLNLLKDIALFVSAIFSALFVVFLLHFIILWIFGLSPVRYLSKCYSAFIFALSCRSCAATLPLSLQSMKTLGISELTANLAGTFGTCIGQNACAGVYPTFLAILAAIAQKRDVWSIEFLAQLVLYIVISSIGSAGVGGGALNNSLIVLNLFGLPVQIVLTMMSFDPIIQMGRIVVNLSGCLLAGFVTERIDKEINFDILYDRISLDELEEKDPSVEPLIGESLLRSNGSGCNYCTGVCQTK